MLTEATMLEETITTETTIGTITAITTITITITMITTAKADIITTLIIRRITMVANVETIMTETKTTKLKKKASKNKPITKSKKNLQRKMQGKSTPTGRITK